MEKFTPVHYPAVNYDSTLGSKKGLGNEFSAKSWENMKFFCHPLEFKVSNIANYGHHLWRYTCNTCMLLWNMSNYPISPSTYKLLVILQLNELGWIFKTKHFGWTMTWYDCIYTLKHFSNRKYILLLSDFQYDESQITVLCSTGKKLLF